MYRHKIVQGLADLIEKYGGGGKDPMMRAVWYGIRGQVPTLLQTLDASESAVSEIRSKLMEVLEVKGYIEKEVAVRIAAGLEVKPKPKKAKIKAGPDSTTAEAIITVEPTPEEASGD